MTRVDFYILQDSRQQACPLFTCKLAEKAYRQLQKKRTGYSTAEPAYRTCSALYYLQRTTLRRKLPFTLSQIQTLLTSFDDNLKSQFSHYAFPAAGVIKALEDFVDRGEDFGAVTETVGSIAKKAAKQADRDVQKLGGRILGIIGMAPELPIRAGEAWADAAEGRSEYRFTREEKLHNVQILEAIVASAATNTAQQIS